MSKLAGVLLLEYSWIKPILLVHDEWVIEVDEDRAEEALQVLSGVMLDASKKSLTHLEVPADPVISRVWKK